MTMYKKIKSMTQEEMKQFIYWVYMCGNKDGANELQDDEYGYFGGAFLDYDADEVMKFVNADS